VWKHQNSQHTIDINNSQFSKRFQETNLQHDFSKIERVTWRNFNNIEVINRFKAPNIWRFIVVDFINVKLFCKFRNYLRLWRFNLIPIWGHGIILNFTWNIQTEREISAFSSFSILTSKHRKVIGSLIII